MYHIILLYYILKGQTFYLKFVQPIFHLHLVLTAADWGG